jgi:hypothetical protein
MNTESQTKDPEMESVIKAMELAWKDHHHARDQTWKTIQIVALICAGLVTIDYQFKDIFPTLCASFFVIMAAGFGISITYNHRKLERRKFIHIMNCEEFLNLHRDDLIPLYKNTKLIGLKEKESVISNNTNDIELINLIKDSSVKLPKKFTFLEIINPFKTNTALFILRMHISIILFSILIIILRITAYNY